MHLTLPLCRGKEQLGAIGGGLKAGDILGHGKVAFGIEKRHHNKLIHQQGFGIGKEAGRFIYIAAGAGHIQQLAVVGIGALDRCTAARAVVTEYRMQLITGGVAVQGQGKIPLGQTAAA